jgi:hypothetical protein
MLWQLKYAVMSFLLGFSILGLNLTLKSDGGAGFISMFASIMLILMGVMDLLEYMHERGRRAGKE